MQTKGNDGKAWDDLHGRMKAALGEFGKEFAPERAGGA